MVWPGAKPVAPGVAIKPQTALLTEPKGETAGFLHAPEAARTPDGFPAGRQLQPDLNSTLLQSAIGNRAAGRLIAPAILQPKLAIGAPDDVYEKEAGAVAAEVMTAQSSLLASRAGPHGSEDNRRRRRLSGKAANQNLARQILLRRIPIRTLQQTMGNRALARLLQETLPAKEPLQMAAARESQRKCACGAKAEGECAECRKKRLALQRDSETAAWTHEPPAAASLSPVSSDETPDDRGAISLGPLTVEKETQGPSVEGGCDGLRLHGTATPTFTRNSTVENRVVSKGEGCDCAKGVQCIHVTGTLVTNYSVSVAIDMPGVPGGLTRCEQAKVQDFLNHVLRPHELDHKAKFETYNGQTKRPVDLTGCGRDDINSQIGAIQDAENTPRQAAAQALSDSLDPFVRTIDCSDCQKQSSSSGAGEGTNGDQDRSQEVFA